MCRCFVSGCDNSSTSYNDEFVAWAIPKGSSCSRFHQNPQVTNEQLLAVLPSDVDIGGGHHGLSEDHPTHMPSSEDQCTPEHFSNDTLHGVESCYSHFVYDRSVREDSIVSEVMCITINKHTIKEFCNDTIISYYLLIYFWFQVATFLFLNFNCLSEMNCSMA
jgi:hypothetical protein